MTVLSDLWHAIVVWLTDRLLDVVLLATAGAR